jgi:hypothetical protein
MFFALIFTLKEKRQHKSEKEFENEEKRKSAVTFVTALFFLVAGTGISRPASQSEWTLGGLYYEKLDRFSLFFALILILTLKEKRKYKSEKKFESEVKRKSAVTFVTALFFLVERSIELSNLIWEGLEKLNYNF